MHNPKWAYLTGLSVLVVDDDYDSRQLVSCYLEAWVSRIYEAPGGNPAWEILKATSVELVITDMDMRDGNGVELAQKMRTEDNSSSSSVILAISADFSPWIVSDEVGGLFDGFCLKPFSKKQFYTELQESFKYHFLKSA